MGNDIELQLQLYMQLTGVDHAFVFVGDMMENAENRIMGIQIYGKEAVTVRCLECELRARSMVSWAELAQAIAAHISKEPRTVEVLLKLKEEQYLNLERFYRLVCEDCKKPLIKTAYRYTLIVNFHTKRYKSANRSQCISEYMDAVEQDGFVFGVVFDEVDGQVLCWNDKNMPHAQERAGVQ